MRVNIKLHNMQSTISEAEQERTRSYGKAALGGPFSLQDHNGQRRTDQDFLGQWVMLYFGFTFCPDICPDELEKMATVVTNIGGYSMRWGHVIMFIAEKIESLPNLQPLFITVDPERDSPAVMKEYLKGMA